MIRYRVKDRRDSVALSRPSDVEGFTAAVRLPIRGPRLARYVDVPAAYTEAADADKGLVRVAAK
jgi:hypothetical protein